MYSDVFVAYSEKSLFEFCFSNFIIVEYNMTYLTLVIEQMMRMKRK